MNVNVELFGFERIKKKRFGIRLGRGSSILNLLDILEEKYKRKFEKEKIRVLVNGKAINKLKSELFENDVITIFPIIGGG